MNAVAFYLALAIVIWSVRGRPAGLAATALAVGLSVVIGISRIYLGFHYLTDVVGGLLAGVSWVLICLAAFRAPPLARFWRGSDESASPTDRPPPGGTSS
jgi:undecaprenyl-diphosphatase